MIDAKHLMVGNLFTDDQNEILKIDLIDSIEETVNANGMEDISISDLIPIPLTEDILLKCGFECTHKNNKHYTINDPNGYKDSHKISIFPAMNEQWHIAFSDNLGGYKDYIPTTKIKYLHQLQNLYFALTQKELTVQL